jgi:hypothetical protein
MLKSLGRKASVPIRLRVGKQPSRNRNGGSYGYRSVVDRWSIRQQSRDQERSSRWDITGTRRASLCLTNLPNEKQNSLGSRRGHPRRRLGLWTRVTVVNDQARDARNATMPAHKKTSGRSTNRRGEWSHTRAMFTGLPSLSIKMRRVSSNMPHMWSNMRRLRDHMRRLRDRNRGIRDHMRRLRDGTRGLPDHMHGLRDRTRGLPDHMRDLRSRNRGLPDRMPDLRDRMRGLPDRMPDLRDRMRGLPDRMRGLPDRMRGLRDRNRGLRDRMPGMQEPWRGGSGVVAYDKQLDKDCLE